MFFPATLNRYRFYYPVGNTPAVCLTRSLPPEADATVLSLGCGDLRNVLFTSYADENLSRAWDFTLSDYEPAIIARNILFLTLIIDKSASDDELWDLSYHFRITPHALSVFHTQAKKLAGLTTSPAVWSSGPYTQTIRIASSDSLPLLRNQFSRWAAQSTDANSEEQPKLDRLFKTALDVLRSKRHDSSPHVAAALTPAPASSQHIKEIGEIHVRYEKVGTVREPIGQQRCANPTFIASDSETFAHYSTNPLHGFHLALAKSPLAAGSPLKSPDHEGASSLVEVARREFTAWIVAFKQRVASSENGNGNNGPIFRFIIADALMLGHGLQARAQPVESRPTFYRDQWTSDVLVLDDDIPTAFNVVDTSNLIDHLGGVNLLAAAAPLLAHSPVATLHTELLLQRSLGLSRLLQAHLCGEVATMSVLFGVLIVEYWTDTSASVQSCDSLRATVNMSSANPTAMTRNEVIWPSQLRLTWKRCPSATLMEGHLSRVLFQPRDMALVLYDLYCNMYKQENAMAFLHQSFFMSGFSSLSNLKHTRAAFVAAISAARHTVEVDWHLTAKCLLNLVVNDEIVSLTLNYVQEIILYLHLFNIFTEPTLGTLPSELQPRKVYSDVDPSLARPGLVSMPSVVCVTMRIPRNALDVFSNADKYKIGSPAFRCALQRRMPAPLRIMGLENLFGSSWQNLFPAIQMCFGRAEQDAGTDGGAITITEDLAGWAGRSTLIVSFLTPTWILLRDPTKVSVVFGVIYTPSSIHTLLGKLGFEMEVFSASLSNTSTIMISKTWPNKNGSVILGSSAVSQALAPPVIAARESAEHWQAAVTDSFTDELALVSSGVTVHSGGSVHEALKSGAVSMSSLSLLDSPCRQQLKVGPRCLVDLRFPCPVDKSKHDLTVGRGSSSSVIAVKGLVADRSEAARHPEFMYPVELAPLASIHTSSASARTNVSEPLIPILSHMPRSNLDAWPILDLSRPADVDWLSKHITNMFSEREMLLRSLDPENPSRASAHRLALKEKLLVMFLGFSGLRGKRAKSIALRSAGAEKKVEALILPEALRLDLNAQTVVLDAAVIVFRQNEAASALSSLLVSATEFICDADELLLWKAFLPVCTERCRVWAHKPGCEYTKQAADGLIPGSSSSSAQPGARILCSCGRGVFPEGWGRNVTGHWKGARALATRAAIAPVFPADARPPTAMNIHHDAGLGGTGSAAEPALGIRCHKCGTDKGAGRGGVLMKCSKCQATWYCGGKCQREDWKVHKRNCKETRKEKRQYGR